MGWILPGRMGPRGSTLFDSGRGRHTRRTTSPAAFLRDPHAGSRGGSTHDPDSARPFAARYDRDLHPRFDGAHAPRSPSDASSWMRALPQKTRVRNRSRIRGASSGAKPNPVLPFHGCRTALNASLMELKQRRLSPSGNPGTVTESADRSFRRAAGRERGASVRLRRSLPSFSPARNCRHPRRFEAGHGSATSPIGALIISYYGYRYLDTQLGRWLSRDPIGEKGGLNLYGFTRNKPMLYKDHLGLQEVEPPPQIPDWVDPETGKSGFNPLEIPTYAGVKPLVPGPHGPIGPPGRISVHCQALFSCTCCPAKLDCGSVEGGGVGEHDNNAEAAKDMAKKAATVAANRRCVQLTCPRPDGRCSLGGTIAIEGPLRSPSFFRSDNFVCEFYRLFGPA